MARDVVRIPVAVAGVRVIARLGEPAVAQARSGAVVLEMPPSSAQYPVGVILLCTRAKPPMSALCHKLERDGVTLSRANPLKWLERMTFLRVKARESPVEWAQLRCALALKFFSPVIPHP